MPSRIVNVSSAYHVTVDGSMLQPHASGEKNPIAARADVNTLKHRRRSYGNNKLAQVLHTHELDRRLKDGNHNVEVVSVCPGWVGATGIVHATPIGKVINAFGFDLKAAPLVVIGACVNPSLVGGEHCTNYVTFWRYFPFWLLNTMNMRDTICDFLAATLLFVQAAGYGFNVVHSSPDSYNTSLARDLYEWTEEAVKSSSN